LENAIAEEADTKSPKDDYFQKAEDSNFFSIEPDNLNKFNNQDYHNNEILNISSFKPE